MHDTLNSAPVEAPASPAAATEPAPAPQPMPAPAGLPDRSPEHYESMRSAPPSKIEPASKAVTPLHSQKPGQTNHLGAKGFTPPKVDPALVPKAETPPAPTTRQAVRAELEVKPLDAAGLIGDYYDTEEPDAYGFLERLYDRDSHRYEKLVDAVLDAHNDHFRTQLRIPTPNHIPEEYMRQIPVHLRETAANLSPDVWETVASSPRETGLQILEGAKEIEYLREQAHQREVEKYNETIDRAARESRALIDKMSEEYMAVHNKALAAWKPAGEDEKANASLRAFALNSVYQDVSEPAQRWAAQVIEYLKYASFHRLAGAPEMAGVYEKEAREIATDFNREFGKLLKARIESLAPYFDDARSWRSRPKDQMQQKGAAPAGKAGPLPPYKPSRTPGAFGLPPSRMKAMADALKETRRQ